MSKKEITAVINDIEEVISECFKIFPRKKEFEYSVGDVEE